MILLLFHDKRIIFEILNNISFIESVACSKMDDFALRVPAWSRREFGAPQSFQNLELHHFCAPTKDIAIRNARLER